MTRQAFATISIVLLMALSLLSACGDNGTEPDPPTTLTFELSANPFGTSSGDGGVIWLSDDQGEVLVAAEWNSDTTLVLDLGPDAPPTVTYSVAASGAHELAVETEFDVPLGATRTHDAHRVHGESYGATVQVANAPECERIGISYQNAYQSSGSIDPGGHDFYFSAEVVDVFVRLDLAGAEVPVAAWVHGVVDGQVVALDYATEGVFTAMVPHTLAMPDEAARCYTSLSAIVDSGACAGSIVFDHQDHESGVPAELVMYTPAWAGDDLNFRASVHMDGEPQLWHVMETDGPVPSAFVMMADDLEVTQVDNASVRFTLSNQWDRADASWFQDGELYASWWMQSGASRNELTLPQLPEEYLERWPDYPRQGFILGNLELQHDDGEGTVLQVGWMD